MENKNIILQKFKNIGLDEKTCLNLVKNELFSKNLSEIIDFTEKNDFDKKIGNLLYYFSGKIDFMNKENIKIVSKKIANEEINKRIQVDKCLEYFKSNNIVLEANQIETFDKFIGVGVNITIEEINLYIKEFLNKNKDLIIEKGGKYKTADLMKQLKDGLEFADPASVNKIYNSLGTEFVKSLDIKKIVEPKKKVKKTEKIVEEEKNEKLKDKLKKILARDLDISINTKELLEEHKKKFGKILTRFPPEPNGFLHIGHCQAMNFSFEMAKVYNGETYLRYDDTNPEKENQLYIDNIKENVVNYMKFKPFKVTYSSDYFDILFDFAIKLIKKGKAFCCFLNKVESKHYRENLKPSPYRDTSVEENLKIFENMKNGFYKEGEVVLRAKIDYLNNENTLRDPPIYRIKYVHHPKSKDKWCIYPLYDFVHGICDSLEGITHSFCTLEFEGRRELYYWFLNELNLYRPYVWEFSRLNISYTVLSKRKINELINLKLVDGWDDPRLFTINGLNRRGINEKYIKDFLNLVGVTRRGNDKVVQMELFENSLRNNLNIDSLRSFAIYEPVELEILNLEKSEEYEVLDYPQNKDSTSKHKISLEKIIFVDMSDVREKDDKNFYGIAPNKLVRLKYGPLIKISSVIKVENTFKIQASIEKDNSKKVKGVIQWISKSESLPSTFTILDKLFNVKNLDEQPGNYIDYFNKNSKIIKNGIINKYLVSNLKLDTKIQFERLGYFNLDSSESCLEENKLKLNFIRIISLREDKEKK